MYYTGPDSCLCGCEGRFVFKVRGPGCPAYGEKLYFLCPNSGQALAFSSRGHWMNLEPAGGFSPVFVSRERTPAHA